MGEGIDGAYRPTWAKDQRGCENIVTCWLLDLADDDALAGLSPGARLASEIVRLRTYAKIRPDGQRETWRQTVIRWGSYMLHRLSAQTDDEGAERELRAAVRAVFRREVMPSMRALWSAGDVLDQNDVALYNCLGRETEFITSDGVKSFINFNHGDTVRVLTHTGAYKPAVVRCYGRQVLHKVNITRGRSAFTVRATRDHQWLLSGGDRTWKINPGDRLAKPPRLVGDFEYINANPEQRMYWAMGFVYGDGTLVKNAKGEYTSSMVRLCGQKGRFLERFQELGFSTSAPKSCNGDSMAYTGHYLKGVPSIEEDGIDNVIAFVRGYLDADGGKNMNGEWPSEFSSIQASGAKQIQFIRSVFPAVGVYLLSETVLSEQLTNYGIRPETVKFNISLGFGDSPGSTYGIKGIEEDAEEDVWCLDVEDDHSFVLPCGIVTGNCAFAPADSVAVFWESLYILMHGTGFGFSVEERFVSKLPIPRPLDSHPDLHIVADSTEGWAAAVRSGVQAWFSGDDMEFDFSKVRPAGAPLKTKGGEASGPEPLRRYLDGLRTAIQRAGMEGRRLTSIEVHDLLCLAARAVQVGGVRRSAMISFSDVSDPALRWAKHYPAAKGLGVEIPAERGQANNSWVWPEGLSRADFDAEWCVLQSSGAGERGIFSPARMSYRGVELRANPCVEIGLAWQDATDPWGTDGGGQFCNLSNVILRPWDDLESARAKVALAAFIGTLQASCTRFKGLRAGWGEVTRRDALLGVGLSGQADCPQVVSSIAKLADMNRLAIDANDYWAGVLGINPAAGVTCGKPDGNSSVFLGCSSGIHAHHARRYLRRITVSAKSPICAVLRAAGVPCIPEWASDAAALAAGTMQPEDVGGWLFELPMRVADSALVRGDETALGLLDRLDVVNAGWLAEKGHNQSVTVNVRADEWDGVRERVWERGVEGRLGGVSFLPDSGIVYYGTPLTDLSEDEYDARVAALPDVDWSALARFETGVSEGARTFACAGGSCEIV